MQLFRTCHRSVSALGLEDGKVRPWRPSCSQSHHAWVKSARRFITSAISSSETIAYIHRADYPNLAQTVRPRHGAE